MSCGVFCEKYCSSSLSKYFDCQGEEIRIHPMADGRFLAAYFTPIFTSLQRLRTWIYARAAKVPDEPPSFRRHHVRGKQSNVAATVYAYERVRSP